LEKVDLKFMEYISREIKYMASVGTKRAELLAKELGIVTIEDLLAHYPFKYIDRSRFYYLHEVTDTGTFYQVKGKILNFETRGEGHKQRLTATFTDGRTQTELVWFGAKAISFARQKLRLNTEYVLFGHPSLFNERLNFTHPELELPDALPPADAMGLQPYYNTTEKMKANFLNSKAIQKIMFNVVYELRQSTVPETLPQQVLDKFHILDRKSAYANIHFPANSQILERARSRFKFEELFYVQLSILQQTSWRNKFVSGFVFNKIGNYFNTFYNYYLPFSLTDAQKRVVREIREDMCSGRQMNRLLQGDVGSGKTIVALLSMLIAADNGFQSALMAPTEILATQHYETLSALLEKMNINIALLKGATKKKEREKLHELLRNGTIHILTGTHALIEDDVKFQNLGLVIVDEQHRFGVAQRAKMWEKNERPPHVLVMTATPIPRTLAMTVYGDLSVSAIDELPPGRKPIQTYHYYENKRMAMNGFIEKQVRAGRQIYIVYPLIEESEKIDLQNLEEGFVYIKEMFPKYKISKIHGRMKAAEKDAEMQGFASGETQILVATTVIEVGVNVPNASVMIIENAERFGLAQLHQLRGRVGRGADQSYCILLTKFELSKDTRRRLEIMTQTNDGFRIAEADLQLRGPGDMEGTQQSGLPFDLRIANLATDSAILELARDCAAEILDADAELALPQNKPLAVHLQHLKNQKDITDWSIIS
jgi:ATP-dependent DNA helicase RecG